MGQTAFEIQAETCMSYLPFPQGIRYSCLHALLHCIFRREFVHASLHCIFRRDGEVMSKTRASCFIRGSKHLETIKALGLRPRDFICFSVSWNP